MAEVKTGSAPKKLNATDWPAIAKSFGFGLAITVLVFIGQFAQDNQFGDLTPIIAGILPVVITSIVRWLKDNSKVEV